MAQELQPKDNPLRIFVNKDQFGKDLLTLQQQYRDGLFTDVKIMLSNGKIIHCHGSVLVSKSSFFKALLFTKQPLKEGTSCEIRLDFVDPFSTKVIIEYCYTGNLQVPYERLQHFVQAVEVLQIRGLKYDCDAFLSWKVTSTTASEFYSFACTFDLNVTKMKIEEEFLGDILDNQKFLESDFPPTQVIQKYGWKLKGPGVTLVKLKAVLKWFMFKKSSREDFLEDLLGKLKYNDCDREKYYDLLSKYRPEDVETFRRLTDDELCWTESLLDEEKRHVSAYMAVGKHKSFLSAWFCYKFCPDKWTEPIPITMFWDTKRVCGHDLDHYGACAIPSGFAVIGGAFRKPDVKEGLYPSAQCHFFRTVKSLFDECSGVDDEAALRECYVPLPSMSSARYRHGVENVDNTLYVVGGYTYDPRGLNSVVENDEETYAGMKQKPVLTKKVEALDLRTMNWTEKADMPHGIANPISVVGGNYIYVLGLKIEDGLYRTPSAKKGKSANPAIFMKYSTLQDSWTELPPPPFQFLQSSACGAFVFGNSIFCVATKYYPPGVWLPSQLRQDKGFHVSHFVRFSGQSWQICNMLVDIQIEGIVSRFAMFGVEGFLNCTTTNDNGKNKTWVLNADRDEWHERPTVDGPKKYVKEALPYYITSDGGSTMKGFAVDRIFSN